MGTHYQGTAVETSALDTYIKLSRAADAVTYQVNQHLKEYNLTISQFGALEALYHLGPLNPSVLGEKILRSSGNMTLVVDNLAKRQLVRRERDPNDRRCIIVHITNEGKALIASILPAHVAQVVDALAALSLAEQAQLASLCRKLGLAQTSR